MSKSSINLGLRWFSVLLRPKPLQLAGNRAPVSPRTEWRYVTPQNLVKNGMAGGKPSPDRPNHEFYEARTQIMNLENIRYYVALSCLVFGCSIPYTLLIVWPMRVMIPLEGMYLRAAYIITYVIVAYLGFVFYRKRLRGVI